MSDDVRAAACRVLVGLLCLGAPAAAGVAGAKEGHEPVSQVLAGWVLPGSPFAERLDTWAAAYAATGGDEKVLVPLGPPVATPRVKGTGHGYAMLDLLGGSVTVALTGLGHAVDVWLLDNQPGAGRSLRVEVGDRLIHLVQVPKGADRVTRELGSDAFTGVEVDRILVVPAGARPTDQALLSGSRSLYERLFTKARLVRAGRGASVMPDLGSPPSKSGSQGPTEELVNLGEVSPLVFKGGEVFFRETFAGNGRTCGTCHPAENNQVIDPAFIATLDPQDPLFVAEQQAGQPLGHLEIPPLLRTFGLILENIDDFSDPGNRFVMRSVPHTLSLATSIQLPINSYRQIPDGGTFDFLARTGWSGDGAPTPGLLRDFLIGAIFQHFPAVNFENRAFVEAGGVDFRMPTEDELDAVEAFMLNSGRLYDIDLEQVTLSDPFAEVGRQTFLGSACNVCHHNAGANFVAELPDGTVLADGNRLFNTSVEAGFDPAQGFQGITFPLDGGFGGQGAPVFDFDSDRDGLLDSYGIGKFNVPPLIEAADTGPFFHNNSSSTLLLAILFYLNPPFEDSPANDFLEEIGVGRLDFDLFDASVTGKMLRVLNAGFNLDIAAQRIETANRLNSGGSLAIQPDVVATIEKLLALANAELEDAIEVLAGGGGVNPNAQILAQQAIDAVEQAIAATSVRMRLWRMYQATLRVGEAKADLGTGMDYTMGEGNLLF